MLEAQRLAERNEEATSFSGAVVDETGESMANKSFLEALIESKDEEDLSSLEDDETNTPHTPFGNSDSGSHQNNESLSFSHQQSQTRGQTSTWTNDCNTPHAKEKLISILNGTATIPKQRWGIARILATLVHH